MLGARSAEKGGDPSSRGLSGLSVRPRHPSNAPEAAPHPVRPVPPADVRRGEAARPAGGDRRHPRHRRARSDAGRVHGPARRRRADERQARRPDRALLLGAALGDAGAQGQDRDRHAGAVQGRRRPQGRHQAHRRVLAQRRHARRSTRRLGRAGQRRHELCREGLPVVGADHGPHARRRLRRDDVLPAPAGQGPGRDAGPPDQEGQQAGRAAERALRRRRGLRRGGRGGRGARRVPQAPRGLPPARRQDAGRPDALRPSRHRQDPAGQGRRG